MKRFALSVLLFAASVAMAQGPFDGTWKFNTSSLKVDKPDEYQVSNGRYVCASCYPKIDVKADGTDQKVTGVPYFDTENVKVVDDRSIETTEKKGGTEVGNGKFNVSEDGTTLTVKWSFVSASGKSGNGTTVYKRLGSTPSSGNMVSGQWSTEKVPDASDSVVTFTYKMGSDGLTYTAATGEHYTAKLDGKDYPYMGDPGTTTVSLKKIDDRTIEETDKRNGKVISVTRMTLAPDGKSLSATANMKLTNRQWNWTADKQDGTAAGN
jgi:hypothetical protein